MAVNTSAAVAEGFNWTTLAPCEHLVQIYSREDQLIESLEAYVQGGIENGEVVVLIITAEHLAALNRSLTANGFDIDGAQAHQLLITFDADETLQKFMVKDWPDDALFHHFVHRIVERADGRRLRAFGEMAALLLARGQTDAMRRLEQLWQRAAETNHLTLFRAYPHSDFSHDMEYTLRAICTPHSCLIN